MQKTRPSEVVWRFTKVVYFILTIPIILGISALLLTDTFADKSNSLTLVHDRYLGAIYGILAIASYLLITDLLRRIISYIGNGKWCGFIPYIDLLNGRRILIQRTIIAMGVLIIFLLIGSHSIHEYCTGENEYIDGEGECACSDGYIKSKGMCSPSFEQLLKNSLPSNAFLREYKLVPGKSDTYMGIYVVNYTFDKVSEEAQPYTDCYGEVQGQGLTGNYHIFTYQNGKITSDIEVPLGFREDTSYPANNLTLAYKNTGENNYQHFGGNKPNEFFKYMIGDTDLLNFSDYNNDNLKYEFYLVDHWDQMCGHNNYLIAGFDKNSQKAVIYGIEGLDKKIGYWYPNNFIPNNKGEVISGYECGDHGIATESQEYWKFNSDENVYKLTKSTSKKCPEGTY